MPWKWLRWGSFIVYRVKSDKASLIKHLFRILTLNKQKPSRKNLHFSVSLPTCLNAYLILGGVQGGGGCVCVCVSWNLVSAILKVHIWCTSVSQSNRLRFCTVCWPLCHSQALCNLNLYCVSLHFLRLLWGVKLLDLV